MEKKKFNYQFIFSLSDERKDLIAFHGETDLSLKDTLTKCLDYLSDDVAEDLDKYPMIHCFYQPVNNIENGTQEKT